MTTNNNGDGRHVSSSSDATTSLPSPTSNKTAQTTHPSHLGLLRSLFFLFSSLINTIYSYVTTPPPPLPTGPTPPPQHHATSQQQQQPWVPATTPCHHVQQQQQVPSTMPLCPTTITMRFPAPCHVTVSNNDNNEVPSTAPCHNNNKMANSNVHHHQ